VIRNVKSRIVVVQNLSPKLQEDAMPGQAHFHQLMPSYGLVISLASQSMASITTLNYNISYVIASVAIIDIGTQLKSMGDALQSSRSKHVMRLTSRVFLKWCVRALQVMYKAVGLKNTFA